MANYGPSSAFLLVGGKDISGDVTSLDENVSQLVGEHRGLGASSERWLPTGVGMVDLETQPNLYDDRTAGMLAALQDASGTRQLLGYGVQGTTLGADVAMVDGVYAFAWVRGPKVDDLTMGNGRFRVSGTYYRGAVVGILTSRSGNGNSEGASLDNAASSSGGAHCDLHVTALALGGGTDVVVKVRHSADNISFADLATFTAVTAAGTAQRVTVAGTVNRYLAISWAFTGGSAQTVTPYVAVKRT